MKYDKGQSQCFCLMLQSKMKYFTNTSSFSFPVVEAVVEEAKEVPLMFFPNSRIHSRFSLLFPCLSKRIEATKRKSFFFFLAESRDERKIAERAGPTNLNAREVRDYFQLS